LLPQDHTAQIQVDDCVNCNIFIGPCKGSVFFRDCTDCTVHVASRQIRTRDVKNMRFAVYCPTQPSIEASTNCFFSCWRGAYPGLTAHFAAAELDPSVNTWDKIFDFHAGEDLGAPHWLLEEPAPLGWVEVEVEGAGACNNPVARGDGAVYGAEPEPAPPAQAAPEAEADMFGGGDFETAPAVGDGDAPEALFSEVPQAPAFSAGQGDEAFDLDGGEAHPVAAPVDEGPTALALKMVEIRVRLEEAAAAEAEARAGIAAAGREHLQAFARQRAERIAAARSNNRKMQAEMEVRTEEGMSPWERALLYIDVSAKQCHTKDVSRLQAVLFKAKAKNLAVPSYGAWQG